MKKYLALFIGLILLAMTGMVNAWWNPARGAGVSVAAPVEYTVYITENTTDFNSITFSAITAYTGVSDTHIKEGAATTNYATASPIEATYWASNDRTTALIKFTGLSNIPSGATVTSVELGINSYGTVDATATVNRVLPNWVVAQATWNIYSTGNNWGTAGAESSGTDYSATTTDSWTCLGASQYWVTLTANQLKTDVQGMIDGTYSNYGWKFTGGGGGSKVLSIISSEGENGTRPYLKVVYDY